MVISSRKDLYEEVVRYFDHLYSARMEVDIENQIRFIHTYPIMFEEGNNDTIG